MQLIYRAQMFHYIACSDVLKHKPSAVNWRYQVANLTDHSPFQVARNSRELRALNWRFQTVLAS